MFDLNQMAALESFDVDIYFEALLAVSKADGNLADIEVSYLKDQAVLMNFDLDSIINKKMDLSDISINNASNFTKKVIIRDCISLAYIDGHYDEKEKEEIIKIGQLIGVSNEDIKKIEAWLLEYWGIIEKGEKLLTS